MVRNAIRDGKLKVTKIGIQTIRVMPEQVLAWLRSSEESEPMGDLPEQDDA